MAGKWLLEMLGILDKGQQVEGGQGGDKQRYSSGTQIISQDESGTSSWSDVKAEPRLGEPEYDSEGNVIGYSKDIGVTIESVPPHLFDDKHDSNNPKMHDGGIVSGSPGQDIPATLEAGEAVLPAKSVKMLGVENILGLIQGTNKKNISSSNISDSSEDKSDGFSKDLKSNLVSGNISDGLKPEAVSGTPGVDGVPGMDGVDGKDGSSGINLIQTKITKVISSEPQKKDPKTIVLPVDSAQIPIELPPQRSRQQIINPSGSASNSPDIAFPPSTKSDSFGAFETRMIYNIVGG